MGKVLFHLSASGIKDTTSIGPVSCIPLFRDVSWLRKVKS